MSDKLTKLRIRENEWRNFIACQHELRHAVRKKHRRIARLALAEIEGLWLHSDWPRLREACARFMTAHANHGDFFNFAPLGLCRPA
jgi:hypothetical protein